MQINRTNSMRRAAVVLAACAAAVAPGAAAQAQSPYALINASAESSPITVTPLAGGLTMLSGSGGNITVLPGPDGALLVDAGIALSREKLTAALAGLGAGSPRYLVNTHWHWDHTDGNGWLRAAGAMILAHPKTIEHLSDTIRVVEWEHTFEPTPAGALPQTPVAADRTLQLNGETVRILTYPDGHTDGDLRVRFDKADVVSLGDTFWNGQYPFIDYVAGGGIQGLIAQTEVNLAEVGERTVIVPGHGPAASRADLVAYRDMLVDVRDRIARLKARGLTLEQVIEARPTASYDAKWGASVVTPAMFTGLVYRGV